MKRFVIVGAGIAGHRAAMELARLAPLASITLLSNEPELPYDRPPLSKELLIGSKTEADIRLSGAATYAERGIAYLPGNAATAIARDERVVLAQDGRRFPYDALLLATGSRPRRLAAECSGNADIFYLRTLEDAVALKQGLRRVPDVAIIGGGFIGLEVAAVAKQLGCQVTVHEAAPRLLARGMPPEVAAWVRRLHEEAGVTIRLSSLVSHMADDDDGVWLAGPDWTQRADLVVAGIGVEPNTGLATAAGLTVADGILVDEYCRTSDPAIFAAGEVTARPMLHGGPRRLESWKAAGDQGAAAARVMAGEPVTFEDVPWFWSDQYATNIQVVGLPDLGVSTEIFGDPGSAAWTLVTLDGVGGIVGGVTINRGRDASLLKRAMRTGADISVLRSKPAALVGS